MNIRASRRHAAVEDAVGQYGSRRIVQIAAVHGCPIVSERAVDHCQRAEIADGAAVAGAAVASKRTVGNRDSAA